MFSIILPKAAIQGDKQWSKFETTLLKVPAGITLIAALIYV